MIEPTSPIGESPEWLEALEPLGTDASKPFLETAPPPPNAQRLLLVPALRRWVVFSLHPKTHRPVVVHSERGFDGLCNCALKLLENLKKS